MSTPGSPPHKSLTMVDARQQLLVFAVRMDGEAGLYVADGVTAEQAAQLLEMMAAAVRTDPRFA